MSDLNELIGKKIEAIYMNDEFLMFDTDNGRFMYTVEGDCCSSSYFWDFLGVEKLLKNGPITSVEEIPLEIDDNDPDLQGRDVVVAYGFRFITEDPIFGEVSSVMSFRNDSNGYYGGWLYKTPCSNFTIVVPKLLTDCTGTM